MIESLVSGVKNKKIVDLAKSITIVENNLKGYKELLSSLYQSNNQIPHKIGITGPPGAGKSTITNELAKIFLSDNKNVGIICVDPSSPFKGGAILGDRVRMKDLRNNKDIFIRSFSSRGNLGGLSSAISDVEILYESFGFDVIIYETVGVGQIELDIINFCDTFVLCLTPESGDEIQMMKSGLLECCDIIAINKSDRPGAGKLEAILSQLFDLNNKKWKIPIIKTIALRKKGMNALFLEIYNHYKFLLKKSQIKNKVNDQYMFRLKKIAKEYLLSDFFDSPSRDKLIKKELAKKPSERLNPYNFFDKIKNI